MFKEWYDEICSGAPLETSNTITEGKLEAF